MRISFSNIRPAMLVKELVATYTAVLVYAKAPQLLPCVLPLLESLESPAQSPVSPLSRFDDVCPYPQQSMSNVFYAPFQRVGHFITDNLNQHTLRHFLKTTTPTTTPDATEAASNVDSMAPFVPIFGPSILANMSCLQANVSVASVYPSADALSRGLNHGGTRFSPDLSSASSITNSTWNGYSFVRDTVHRVRKPIRFSFGTTTTEPDTFHICTFIASNLRRVISAASALITPKSVPIKSVPIKPVAPKLVTLRSVAPKSIAQVVLLYELLFILTIVAINFAVLYFWTRNEKPLPSWLFQDCQTRNDAQPSDTEALKPRRLRRAALRARTLNRISSVTHNTQKAARSLFQAKPVPTVSSSLSDHASSPDKPVVPETPQGGSCKTPATTNASATNTVEQDLVVQNFLAQGMLWTATQQGLITAPTSFEDASEETTDMESFRTSKPQSRILDLATTDDSFVLGEDEKEGVDEIEFEQTESETQANGASGQSGLNETEDEKFGTDVTVEEALNQLLPIDSPKFVDEISCPELDDSASDSATLTPTLGEDLQVAEICKNLYTKLLLLKDYSDEVEKACGDYRHEHKKPPHFRNQRINYLKQASQKLKIHVSLLPKLKEADESMTTYLAFMEEARIEESPQILAARLLHNKVDGLLEQLTNSQELLQEAERVVKNPGMKGSVVYRNALKLIAQNVFEYFKQVLKVSSSPVTIPPLEEAPVFAAEVNAKDQ